MAHLRPRWGVSGSRQTDGAAKRRFADTCVTNLAVVIGLLRLACDGL